MNGVWKLREGGIETDLTGATLSENLRLDDVAKRGSRNTLLISDTGDRSINDCTMAPP